MASDKRQRLMRESAEVLLLVTNDTHSQMMPTKDDVGGAARRVTYLQGRAHEAPLILDVGDSFQGSPFFSFFGGEVEMAALEKMGYRATAIGNHDFDSGLAELWRHAKEHSPSVQLLCANLVDESGKLEFLPHTMYEVGPNKVRVGVVALLGEEAWSVVDKKLQAGLKLVPPFPAAEQSVKELRSQGAELVICLSHTGIDDDRGATNDMALAATGLFDAVFSGHAHFTPRRMDMLRVGECLVHPGVHNGQAVVWAKFQVQRGPEGTRCVSKTGGADLIDSSYAEEQMMAAWLKQYSTQFEELLNQHVGSCVEGGLLKYTTLPPPINYIYHASLAAALVATFQDRGAVIGAINSAGIRAELPGGALKYKDIEACWPWKGNVHSCEVKGRLLLELLNLNAKRMSTAQDGGMFLHFNRRLSYEASAEGALVKAEVCGKALEPEAWYCLVADAYLVTNYIPSFPQHGATGIRNVADCGIMTQKCIMDHVRELHLKGRAFGEPEDAF